MAPTPSPNSRGPVGGRLGGSRQSAAARCGCAVAAVGRWHYPAAACARTPGRHEGSWSLCAAQTRPAVQVLLLRAEAAAEADRVALVQHCELRARGGQLAQAGLGRTVVVDGHRLQLRARALSVNRQCSPLG